MSRQQIAVGRSYLKYFSYFFNFYALYFLPNKLTNKIKVHLKYHSHLKLNYLFQKYPCYLITFLNSNVFLNLTLIKLTNIK